MIEKQRAFYAETHGWDDSFLDYLHETFDADIENIWIAESAGRFAGCVGLVKHHNKVSSFTSVSLNPNFSYKGRASAIVLTVHRKIRSN